MRSAFSQNQFLSVAVTVKTYVFSSGVHLTQIQSNLDLYGYKPLIYLERKGENSSDIVNILTTEEYALGIVHPFHIVYSLWLHKWPSLSRKQTSSYANSQDFTAGLFIFTLYHTHTSTQTHCIHMSNDAHMQIQTPAPRQTQVHSHTDGHADTHADAAGRKTNTHRGLVS